MKLYDLLNDAYHQYRQDRTSFDWNDVCDFLYDKEKCLRLLYHYLDLGPQNWQSLNIVSLYRSQHIFVTFLMGLGIAKHYNLLKGVNVMNERPDEYLWMLTSIVHDYGYLKKGISEAPMLCDVDGKYGLLTDNSYSKQLNVTIDYSSNYSQFLTYSYDVISRYYSYNADRIQSSRKKRYCSKDNETVDHGIFGACKCYEEYCDFFISYLFPHDYVEKK